MFHFYYKVLSPFQPLPCQKPILPYDAFMTPLSSLSLRASFFYVIASRRRGNLGGEKGMSLRAERGNLGGGMFLEIASSLALLTMTLGRDSLQRQGSPKGLTPLRKP